MMKRTLSFLTLLICSGFLSAQNAPSIVWQKSFGGSKYDEPFAITGTMDNGFIVAGFTKSNDYDVSQNFGATDFWLVKMDSSGEMQWQKSFGGTEDEQANRIRQTSDGGFIVIGYTFSNDSDVTGNHGSGDYWIVKIDAWANVQWQKCLGGSFDDHGYDIRETGDHGYIVCGYVNSPDGDVTGYHDYGDVWVAKLDSMGGIQWQKCYGGSSQELGYVIELTADGGYVIAGVSGSSDGDLSINHGFYDAWIFKLDSTGFLQWQKAMGGSNFDYAHDVKQTPDHCYIMAGMTASNDGDVLFNHGGGDAWVVKFDSSGNVLWQKSLGGTEDDVTFDIRLTSDEKYIVSGYTLSNDYDVSENNGSEDYWVAELDSEGNIIWQKCLGGTSGDYALDITLLPYNAMVLAGESFSSDSDVTSNYGSTDYWIVKLAPDVPTIVENLNPALAFTISPNPSTGNFKITFPNALQPYSVLSITNLLGQKLFEEEIAAGTSTQSFNFSNWQKGIYMVRLQSENGIKSEKLVIQ